MKIYFDKNKVAHSFAIENPSVVIDDALWQQYAGTNKWDIINNEFIDITHTQEWQDAENTNIRQQRQQRFAKETDPLAAQYTACQLMGEFEEGAAETLKAKIAAQRQKIREDLPYI